MYLHGPCATAMHKSCSVRASDAYDHTTLNAPVLVWSPKLSSVGPAQYLDGWPPGNSRCCRLFFFSLPPTFKTFFFPTILTTTKTFATQSHSQDYHCVFKYNFFPWKKWQLSPHHRLPSSHLRRRCWRGSGNTAHGPYTNRPWSNRHTEECRPTYQLILNSNTT